jgi:hypothetical protein
MSAQQQIGLMRPTGHSRHHGDHDGLGRTAARPLGSPCSAPVKLNFDPWRPSIPADPVRD